MIAKKTAVTESTTGKVGWCHVDWILFCLCFLVIGRVTSTCGRCTNRWKCGSGSQACWSSTLLDLNSLEWNSTKLKDRVYLISVLTERAVMCFLHLLGSALCKACDSDCNDNAICLAKAAKIVQRDMLKLQSTFTGTFEKDCKMKSVPHSLYQWFTGVPASRLKGLMASLKLPSV